MNSIHLFNAGVTFSINQYDKITKIKDFNPSVCVYLGKDIFGSNTFNVCPWNYSHTLELTCRDHLKEKH